MYCNMGKSTIILVIEKFIYNPYIYVYTDTDGKLSLLILKMENRNYYGYNVLKHIEEVFIIRFCGNKKKKKSKDEKRFFFQI